MASVESIRVCRACGGAPLEPVIDLGSQPLANALRRPGDPSEEARFPLAAVLCRVCTLVQLTVTVPPARMFDEYVYFSSTSSSMVGSMASLAARLTRDRGLGQGDLVVEVASNDGYLLKHYLRRGIPVLGVDPAANVAEVAIAEGVPTIVDYFGARVAADLVASGHRASVIHANNVMAHAPSINDFVGGLARLVRPDGVIVIETPNVVELVARTEFDTIYHEHVFYYSLTSLRSVLRRHGLVVTDVEELEAHGGSLRIFASPRAREGDRVRSLLGVEAAAGVDDPIFYASLARRVDGLRDELIELLLRLRREGHRLAGYGAAAKGTVLLNHFGIGVDMIDFIVDASPHKQGLVMPGVAVPIDTPARLLSDRPDDVLLLAWNWKDEIVREQAAYLEGGGRFIVPVPEVALITAGG
jgi:SAM-dependent methyltransferase